MSSYNNEKGHLTISLHLINCFQEKQKSLETLKKTCKAFLPFLIVASLEQYGSYILITTKQSYLTNDL